jgi:hypothetical protein
VTVGDSDGPLPLLTAEVLARPLIDAYNGERRRRSVQQQERHPQAYVPPVFRLDD